MADWIAYHKEHQKEFGGTQFHTKNRRVVAGDVLYVVLGLDERNTRYVLAGKYRVGPISDEHSSFGGREFDRTLPLERILVPPHAIALDPVLGDGKAEFRKTYASNIGMQAPTDELRKLFHRLLQSNVHGDEAAIGTDIETVVQDVSIPKTTRKQWIDARVGQGVFRDNVIEVWGGEERCAVTGIVVRQLLVASHIIPWKESVELRLEGTNGILLCAQLDKLFDQYLISFSRDGQVIRSKRLSGDDWNALRAIGVTERLELNFTLMNFSSQEKVQKNLRVHRDRLAALDAGGEAGTPSSAVALAAA